MLHYKAERAIFIIIFLVCFIVVGFYATDLKYNVLPLNKGLTPEQVIENEFPQTGDKDLNYKYKIDGDYLFVCWESGYNLCNFDFALRNHNSGFMFDVPGIKFGSNSKTNIGVFELDKKSITSVIYKTDHHYIIEFHEIQKSDIHIFLNDTKIEPFTFDDAVNQYWVAVIADTDTMVEINCIYQGQRTHIFNADEIKSMF